MRRYKAITSASGRSLVSTYNVNLVELEAFLSPKQNENTLILPVGAENVRVSRLSRVKGVTHGVFAFDLVFRNQGKEFVLKLILKLYPSRKEACTEYLSLKALESVNFHVPHAYARVLDEGVLGYPFIIIERVNGKILRDYLKKLNTKDALIFLERFADTLRVLHELAIEKLNLNSLENPKDEFYFAKKQTLREEPEVSKIVKQQGFEWATKWLEQNFRKCPCNRYSILHGDMNLKNFLVTEDGEIVFLDWTYTEIGDALKDVAYAYHAIRQMFGVNNVNKKGELVASYFLRQYTQKSSRKIDAFTLKFYLFSAGLRETVCLKLQSEEFSRATSVIKCFGAKFLLLYPFVGWHFKRRYRNSKSLLENMAGNYEQTMFGTVGGKLLSSMELNKILAFLKPKPSELILDVGTGSGRIARQILFLKATVVGVDVGRSTLRTSKELLRKFKRHEVVIAHGEYLPFRQNSFDGAVCVRALKYFPKYSRGIREISRVLKPGNRFVFDLSSVLGYEVIIRRMTHLPSVRNSHVFNIYKMRYQLKQYGFTIIDSIPLQKIPEKIWNSSSNHLILKFLLSAETVLIKTTPSIVSRSILLACINEKE